MSKRLAGFGATVALLAGIGLAAAPAATATPSSIGPFATKAKCVAERSLFAMEGYTHLGDCVLQADGWRFTMNVLVPD